ncbi:MAG: glycosyltransferase family 2 protein, partial [Candidatus Bathyarchaeota archaeon]
CTIVNVRTNTGNKAKAQMIGLKYITGDLMAFTDADTILDKTFLENSLPYFLDPLIGAVLGQVFSNKRNWLTAARQMQYLMGQILYKKGMNVLNAITVIPGCAGVVRRNLFSASFDTVTEDMDMTLKIQERDYRIVYAPQAKVYTNDPADLKSYIRQITRWNAGFFQNVRKHFKSVPVRIKIQMIIPFLEIFLTLGGGLLFLVFFTVTSALTAFLFEIIILVAFAVYSAVKLSRRDLVTNIPLFFFLKIVETCVWVKCLIKELVLNQHEFRWLRADRI